MADQKKRRGGGTRALGAALSLLIHLVLIVSLSWRPPARQVTTPQAVEIQILPPVADVPKVQIPKDKVKTVSLRDRVREVPIPVRVSIETIPTFQSMEPPDTSIVESNMRVSEAPAPPVMDTDTPEEKASSSDYAAQLAKRLEEVKHYPDVARVNKQVGTVLLSFTLHRSGRLLAWRVEHSSGYASLDAEAGSMLAKAIPFPPFPESLTKVSESFVVPIEFSSK